MRKAFFIVISFFSIILTSCINDDVSECSTDISLTFSTVEFRSVDGSSTRATTYVATAAEKQIDNLYVFLFPTTGSPNTNVYRYFLTKTTTDPVWTVAGNDGTVRITLSEIEAGIRDVYIVANCVDIKTQLDGANSVASLQTILRTVNPWAITTPILMEGHKLAHDFSANFTAGIIPMERAVAKLLLNITLDPAFQNSDHNLYKYRYINFGNQTYVLPHLAPQTTGNVVSTDWLTNWTSFIPTTGTITGLTLESYINEYKNTITTDPLPVIEINLPYNDGGFLPPPEFGQGDIYRLQLSSEIVRNTIYKYDLVITK